MMLLSIFSGEFSIKGQKPFLVSDPLPLLKKIFKSRE